MELPKWLRSVLDWVRAGYPEGVPPTDYVPLFALLGSQLTDEEVGEIADELALTGDADSVEAMRAAIASATSEPPLESDVARVRSRLAAGGWPLAHPDKGLPVPLYPRRARYPRRVGDVTRAVRGRRG